MAIMICGDEFAHYALRHYLLNGVRKEEFKADMLLFSLINLSLKRFIPGRSPRMLVNQLILVFNAFETEAAVNMLVAKTDKAMMPRLKSALLTLGVWRDAVYKGHIEEDHELMMALNNDLEDWRLESCQS